MDTLSSPRCRTGADRWNGRVGGDEALEDWLRAQAFNREFEGLIVLRVRIEADHPQHSDGSGLKCWRWPAANFWIIPSV